MMETMSSSFSVSAIARPPSRGTMIPVKNAPAQRTISRSINAGKEQSRDVRTEDGMNTNNIGHECRAEQNEDHNSHEEHGGSVLDGARSSCQPSQNVLDGEQQQKGPSNTCEQDVEGLDASTAIDQSYGERKKGPPDDIVADASRENDDADRGVEQLQLCENAAEHWEGRDRVRDAGEEHKVREFDGLVDERVIQRHGERGAQAEWKTHAGEGDRHGQTSVPLDHGGIDFEADKEEEEAQPDVGDEREVRNGLGREDMLLESGNAAERSGAFMKSAFVQREVHGDIPRMIPPRTSAMTFGCRIFRKSSESSCVVRTITPTHDLATCLKEIRVA